MGKALAALAVTAGVAGGALVGAPMLAGASNHDPAPPAAAAAPAPPEKGGWAKEALDGLVAKGTITGAQAGAVLEALEEARPKHGPRGKARKEAVEAAAEALGIPVADLRSELRAGRSMADVARAKGVDPKKVVDALVAAGTKDLASLVAAGKITRAQADERLARLPERAAALVEARRPAKPTP